MQHLMVVEVVLHAFYLLIVLMSFTGHEDDVAFLGEPCRLS